MHQAVQRASLRNGYVIGPGRLAGLGAPTAGPTSTQITQQVGSIASAATTAALSATSAASIAAGGTGAILGMAPTLAIPIIGAAIMGVTLAIVVLLNSGCGQTCIVTSNWANQAADALQQNIAAYFALPAPRSVEAKAQALANFDNIWNYLYNQCNNPQLGGAGVNCINDRKRGACKWHQSGNPEFPGQPATGQCWNWFNSYRDPIENDPAVVTQNTLNLFGGNTGTGTTAGTGTATTPISLAGMDASTLVLIAGGALLLFGIAGSK